MAAELLPVSVVFCDVGCHTRLSKGLRNQEMEGQVLEEVAAKIEDQLGKSRNKIDSMKFKECKAASFGWRRY